MGKHSKGFREHERTLKTILGNYAKEIPDKSTAKIKTYHGTNVFTLFPFYPSVNNGLSSGKAGVKEKIYLNLVEANISTLYTYTDRVFATVMPKLRFNIAGQLHSDDEPAIESHTGEQVCRFRGRPIEEKFILHKDKLTSEDILERNLEKRRVIMEVIGVKRFCQILGITKVDHDVDQCGNHRYLYKTRKIDPIVGRKLYFVNVVCPSTDREYFISVPEHTKVADAVAWTFGKTAKTYTPNKET